MFMVAPSGNTKLATSLRAPSFSTHSILSGNAPTEDALEKAIIIAGIMPLKNAIGLIPAKPFKVNE
ncbi:hypothetical protein SDC9_157366 [bioreactor metagenome]|uniref:Uncharacterized protein n=1 Tax=bioreactor metagenome TaxID=1076179 RepID=A0A645FCI5_9ZZZZ